MILLAAPAFDPPKTVGVVVLLDDAQIAGEVEARIESLLRESVLFEMRSAEWLAAEAALPSEAPPTEPSPEKRKQADQLFAEASAAYDEDREPVAIEKLTALSALIDKDPSFSVLDRAKLYLWKTAIYLLLKDERQAEVDATVAIALIPDLKIDPDEFPPQVVQFVSKVRESKRVFTATVKTFPAHAKILLDGRAVPGSFKLLAGKRYQLTVTAPGRRSVTRPVELAADQSFKVRLPLAVPPATETALKGLTTGAPAEASSSAATAVAAKMGVDGLLLVTGRKLPGGGSIEVRCAAVHLGERTVTVGETQTVEVKNAATLAVWGRRMLERGARSNEGVVHPLDPSAVARRQVAGWALESGAGAQVSIRGRELLGRGGIGASTAFAGVGPVAWAEAARGRFHAAIEGGWIDYGISSTRADLSPARSATVDGGATGFGEVRAGYSHPLGGGGAPTFRVGLELAAAYERHAADDVESLHLLTSHRRLAVDARLTGRAVLAVGRMPVAMRARLAVGPWSDWREEPSGASGSSPAPSPSVGAALSVELDRGRWAGQLGYSFERRRVDFSGPASADFEEPLTDARIEETIQGVGVTIGYRF